MSKYNIWDAQNDTSNLAAAKAELAWMRLDLFSLHLPHLQGTLEDSDSLQIGRVQLPPGNWLCA